MLWNTADGLAVARDVAAVADRGDARSPGWPQSATAATPPAGLAAVADRSYIARVTTRPYRHLKRPDRVFESYASKWAYVRDHRMRAGLAARWEDWPYEGEIDALEHA